MRKKGISQEELKIIACISMLIDHVGAAFFPGSMWLRILGRLAFPLYCYLLVEGAAHTRDPKKYGRRLLLGAVLAEAPYDFLFFGRVTWAYQNVMVTLFLGLVMITWARSRKRYGYLLPLCLCFFAAEVLNADYGCWGVALIGLFAVTAEKNHEKLLQLAGMAAIFWLMDGVSVPVFGLRIPIQMFGLAAIVPIALYTGRKVTDSRGLKWAFYLFYPLHMVVLLLIGRAL